MADSNGGVMTSPLSKQQRMYLLELKDDKLPNREFIVNFEMVRFITVLLVNTLIPKILQEVVDRAMTRMEYQFF